VTTPVPGVGGALPAEFSAATTTASVPGEGLGKDAFLKLLVAQMRYQNPLSPVDGQEYMTQMAQFTAVEKLTAIDEAQAELGQWQRALAGQGMVGRHVTATGPGGTPVSGLVTGLRLTPAGPLLTLAGGGMVAVDAVDEVRLPDTTPASP
jgi:flagellar basal-body rod modification protein FlgD